MVGEQQSWGSGWPTTAGGLDGARDWREVESAVADVLAFLRGGDHSYPMEGEGLCLLYTPFDDLGRDEGLDLSWEAEPLGHPDNAAAHPGMAAHPADAVHRLRESDFLAVSGRAVAIEAGAGVDLVADWAGWSTLLREAAEVAAAGPASSDETSGAGFTLQVRWHSATQEWAWRAGGVEMLDEDGNEIGVYEWHAPTPAEALRAALADAPYWYLPHTSWPPRPART